MRTPILTLLLLLSFDASAMKVNKYLSGSWFNPSQNGHGLSIEVISSEMSVVYWYVYHPDGSPTFIIAVGNNNGNVIEAEGFYNSGMRFGEFDPADREEIPWGDIRITFDSCTSATLEYSSDLSYNGEPYGSGSIPLTRLLSIDGMQCASNPNAGLYQGKFHSNVSDDDFEGFAIIAPNNEIAVVSFTAMVGLGGVVVSGKNFSGGGTAVSADPEAEFDEALSISGSIDPEFFMTGNYGIEGVDHGYFDFYSIPSLYRRGVSMEQLVGAYSFFNRVSQKSGSADIAADGKITGTDTAHCEYEGNVSVPDAQFNLLQVTVKVTKCGDYNGTYKGYGAQMDYFSIGDKRFIRLISSNDKFAGMFDLYR